MIYDESYFTGDVPGGYGDYGRTAFSRVPDLKRAADIRGPLLIVGCAYGFTVQELVASGINAYGLDVSRFAIHQAHHSVEDRLVIGSVTERASYWTACQLACTPMFTYIVSENMLCCLTDEEAIKFQKYAEYFAVHVVHLVEERPALAQWYNYKTVAEWKELLKPASTTFHLIR